MNRNINTWGRRGLIATFAAIALAVAGGAGHAQDYPTKAVQLFAPSAGGSGDWAARVLAEGLEKELGQPFVVENRSNLVGIEAVTKAEPDGYTLLFYGSGLWMFPLLQPDVATYDTLRDLQPITTIAGSPSILAVNTDLGIETVEDLIAYAKESPGKLTYSAGQVGSAHHRAGELFKTRAGDLDIRYIPYKGSGQAITAAVSGEVMVTFGTIGLLQPHVDSGRLEMLAVMANERSPLVPDLRSITEAGVTDAEAASAQVLWAPAGVPQDIVNRLNQAAVNFLNSPEAQKTFRGRGLDAEASTPDEVVAILKSEIERGKKIAEEFNTAAK
ncbi:Bug family tripartite tricarboxylate transporter substrate binding protein [Chelativorans alearense]|uniref:Bug family tripartite tricarboxylate transporter substrate binding protein n=1 Tax=Chelativorans alearense TaxID=2681495 RepID=UPI0013D6118B|nr:tripartite tricarboxylate transporter substrate binding protein [Chelativorans alearense]